MKGYSFPSIQAWGGIDKLKLIDNNDYDLWRLLTDKKTWTSAFSCWCTRKGWAGCHSLGKINGRDSFRTVQRNCKCLHINLG